MDTKSPDLSFLDHEGSPRTTRPAQPIKSDGGSSAYYFLPKGATELNDLIEFKEMSFARGNLFKALYRMGEKDGTDVMYDINKIQLFLDRLRGMVEKGQRV